jgi:threonylcarbamoyladenosine tRNA methylthiotransferase MtaB
VRVYFHTFGCKANQYDTEVVRQALESVGAVAVDRPEDADAAVVNSCTVTHVGEAKMRSLVRRLARRQPHIQTVVMGCAAALDDGVVASLPRVSAVVGGADPKSVASALGVQPTDFDPVLRRFAGGTRAWLKIQDGCDEHCTFCATTTARGANRSRTMEEILIEARALARHHHEIVLTGVHIGTYGRDLDGNVTLGHLVDRLITEVDGPRYRLSSVEATEVCDRLRELMVAAPDRLAPHLHAPLQSGSDIILKRMGRHWYTAATYRERCESLAAGLPLLGLGADVMVGFPGETDADFAATWSLVEALPFTYLHVFPYSPRHSASARRIGPAVPPDITQARSAQLRGLADEKQVVHRRRRAGARADVVVLGRQRGRYQGLTEDYLDVYLPSVKVAPPRFSGTLGLSNGTLVAELS